MTPDLKVQVREESTHGGFVARPGGARTAFVGRTLRGPVNRPVYLRSFAEFQLLFGGLWQPSALGYAVEHFFDNGGREAVIVRVVNGARAATLTLPAGGRCLRLRAVRPGTREFLRASVDYDNLGADAGAEFNLTVQRVRVPGTGQIEDQEIFRGLSVRPGDARFVGAALGDSELVTLAATGEDSCARPERTVDAASGLATAYVGSNADGDDGAPLTDYDVIGSEVERTGLFALEDSDYFDLLCIPPFARDADVGMSVLVVAARYCRQRHALLVVDPPAAWHTADDALRGMRHWHVADDNAVMYFPRVLAHDKLRGHFATFAPCGAVAGLLARGDGAFPAGQTAEDAALRPGFRPACLVTDEGRRRLAAAGVNALPAVRAVLRGRVARTLAGAGVGDPGRHGLAARRLTLFILGSVVRGTRWAAGAPASQARADGVTAQVREFLGRLYEAGAFGARPAEEAFRVLWDGDDDLTLGFTAAARADFQGFRLSLAAALTRVRRVTLEPVNDAQFSAADLAWVDRLASRLLQ